MKFLQCIDTLSKWIGKIFRWAALALSMIVLYEVIARYIFNRPTIWAFDTGMMFFSLLFLFGGGYVLWEGGHIRVDVIFAQFSRRTQAIIDTVFYLIFFFPFVWVMIWYGNRIAYRAWLAREISNTSQWGEPIYPWRYVIPLAFLFLFLQGIAEFVRTIRSLRRDDHDS